MPWSFERNNPVSVGFSSTDLEPDAPPVSRPGFGELAAAAWQRESLPGALLLANKHIRAMDNLHVEPNFDVQEAIKGTKYARHKHFFADVNNSTALRQRQAYVDALDRNDRVLSRGGGEALFLSVASSVVDPINLIPVGGVGVASRFRSLPRIIGRSAAVGTLAAASQELPLKQIQPNRSWGEVAANLGGSAVLSGVLGGVIGKLARHGTPFTELDLPTLAAAEKRLRGLKDELDDLVLKGATEEAVLGRVGPVLDDLATLNAPTAREAGRIVQAMAPDIADGKVDIDQVVDLMLSEVPRRMSGSRVVAEVQETIDSAMRQSRMESEAPMDTRLVAATDLPDRVAFRPQPPAGDRLIGFITRDDLKVSSLDSLEVRGEGFVTMQLDAPIPARNVDGWVTGFEIKADVRRFFDPEGLLEGTTRLGREEVEAVLESIQRQGVSRGLEENGYLGWVRLVDSENVRTRELLLRHTADEIFIGEGPANFRINPGVADPVRFSEIGPLTKANLDRLERKLNLHRIPVAGGSGVGQGGIFSFDGRLVRSSEDFFDEVNDPTGIFRRLGNAERTDGRINVNTASLDDLLTVPRLGPRRARAILDFLATRANGRIEDLDELAEVGGLGRGTLDQIRAKLDIRDQIPTVRQDRELANAWGIERVLARINPNTRVIATTKSPRVKEHFMRLFESGGVALDTDGVIRQAIPVETMIKRYNKLLDVYTRQQWDLFLQYRERMSRMGVAPTAEDIQIRTQGRLRGAKKILSTEFKDLSRNIKQLWDADEIPTDNGPLTYTEFRRRIGMAVFMGGKDRAADFAQLDKLEHVLRHTEAIPEVERAAAAMKAEIFDPLLIDMKELGLVVDDDLVKLRNVSEAYYHRVYQEEKIKAEKFSMENAIIQYYVGERGWDVESAVRTATNQVQSILETPIGRMPYDLSRRNTTGAMRTRLIDVPDRVLMPWLETDTDAILRIYLKTVGPDLEVAKYLRSIRRGRVRSAAKRHLVETRGMSDGKAADAVLRAEEKLDALELRFKDVTEELTAMRKERGGSGEANAEIDIELMKDKQFQTLMNEKTKLSEQMNDINQTLGPHWMRNTISGDNAIGRIEQNRSRFDTSATKKEPLDLQPLLDEINEDYQRQLAKAIRDQGADITTGRQTAERITAEFETLKKRDKDVLQQLLDMLRNAHVHATDDLFGVGLTRTMRGLRRWNVLTMAGGFMISSIPDVGRLVLTNGIQSLYGDILDPLISDFRVDFQGLRPVGTRLGPKSRSLRNLQLEVDDLGITFETVMNNRASLITEVQRRMPTTKLETFLERGADAMFLLNGMSLWNDTLKEIVGIQTYLKIARAAREVAEGRSLPDQLIRDFNRLGLEPSHLKRIWQQINHGARPRPGAQIPADRILTDGIPITRFSQWDDVDLREMVRLVLQREADNLIITPGVGDKPLLMSGEVFKTLGQFKSFAFAATTRLTLASAQGLAAHDARVLQQLAIMHFLGMGVFALKTLQYGGDLSKYSVNDWVAEGVDRSGMPAILSEVDGLASALTGGTVSAARLIGARPPTRFIARRNLMRTLAGPSWSRVEAASDLMDAIVNADLKPRDVRHIRNMVPFQNMFYLDWLFDLVEKPAKSVVRNRPGRRTPLGPTMEIEGEQGVPVPTTR